MKTLLLADDEANLRTLVRTTLEDPRYRILEAVDGPTTLELARAELPDLILLDWMMSGMTGLEVMRLLRLDAATRHIPVIMLTAKGQEKDRRQAMSLGVEAYLVKPFSPLDLLTRVEEALATVSPSSPDPSTALADRSADHSGPNNSESQLAFYAQDLKRVVDSERSKSVQLAEANERLKTLNTLKTEFLSFVSHELLTPMNALSAINMLDPAGDIKEQADVIDIVRHGYERLHAFIRRGLDYFAWLSVERVETDTVTDMSALVRCLADEVPALSRPEVDFRVMCGQDLCLVRGEGQHLREALTILLDNAVKFSRTSRVVRLELERHDDLVAVVVADRGVGLAAEVAREMFRPYTIADAAHHSSGTGLNLAIAHAIATAHGGGIRVESPGPERGSRFILTLPVCREASASLPGSSLRAGAA